MTSEEDSLLAALRQFIQAEVAAQGAPTAAHARYVTVSRATTLTGLSEKAIRRKMEDGKWLDGREYRRSPDGGIFIDMKAYSQWVEQGQYAPLQRRACK